ncbi:hypothetical protein MMC24_004435 [Lignoscripta atroalba]|nr:hypothetical protein [Lignoscripta atroalba]
MDSESFGRMSLEDKPLRKPRSARRNRAQVRSRPDVPINPEIQAFVKAGEEPSSPRLLHTPAGIRGAQLPSSSAWRPDPTIPAYQPLPVLPLGDAQMSRGRLGQGFTPYQPIRLVPAFRKVPPWRIDKWHRYASATAAQKALSRPTEIVARPIGRISGSPPKPEPRYNLRQSTIQDSATAEQVKTRFTTPKVKYGTTELPVPEPTSQYLSQASPEPNKLSTPQPLLVVLDLNGTLLARQRGTKKHTARPSMAKFLRYCLENHSVMIWSSARPENVAHICGNIFTASQRRQLLREWGRDTLDLTKAQYDEKVQVYKRLDRIWDDVMLQSRHPHYHQNGRWSQANTILVDDSVLKAKKQPYNLIEIPEFVKANGKEEGGKEVLGQVVAYLEEIRNWDNVSSFIKKFKFEVDKGWDWDGTRGLVPETE